MNNPSLKEGYIKSKNVFSKSSHTARIKFSRGGQGILTVPQQYDLFNLIK